MLSSAQTATTGKSYAAAASSVKTRTVETQTNVTWPCENKHPKTLENIAGISSTTRVSNAATNTTKTDQNKQSKDKSAANKAKKNKGTAKKDVNLQKGSKNVIMHDNIFSALSSSDDESMQTDPPSQGENNHKIK